MKAATITLDTFVRCGGDYAAKHLPDRIRVPHGRHPCDHLRGLLRRKGVSLYSWRRDGHWQKDGKTTEVCFACALGDPVQGGCIPRAEVVMSFAPSVLHRLGVA